MHKVMKRFTAITIILTLCFSILGCTKGNQAEHVPSDDTSNSIDKESVDDQPKGVVVETDFTDYETKVYTYKTVNDEDIQMDITMPNSSSYDEVPLLVFIHGGGYVGGDRSKAYVGYFAEVNQAFLEEGYAVASIDYTLASRSKGTTAEDCFTDGKDSIRWLRKNANALGIDENNIGLFGSSAGGGLAAMIAYSENDEFIGDNSLKTYSSEVNFVVNFYGSTASSKLYDFSNVDPDSSVPADAARKLFIFGIGESDDFKEMEEKIKYHSAINYLDSQDSPTFIMHGTDDTTVSIEQSEHLANELGSLGIAYEFFRVEGRGHSFNNLSQSDKEFYKAEIIKFANSHYTVLEESKSLDFSFSNPPSDLQGIDAKFAKDIPYDVHDKTKFDIFMPNSDEPTGLVIFIHGGGFKAGSKEKYYKGNQAEDIIELLSNNIAVASLDYRLLEENDDEGILKSLNDSKRALQFIRYYSEDFNIRKDDIVLYGGSAGAGTALWIASNDDMKDESSSDPILRESTRVKGLALSGVQATYDFERWYTEIFAEFEINFDELLNSVESDEVLNVYGISSVDEFYSEEALAYRAQVDMLSLMTSDDPEIWAKSTANPNSIPDTDGERNHHPYHVKALKERADEVGITMVCAYGSPLLYSNTDETYIDFIIRKVNEN